MKKRSERMEASSNEEFWDKDSDNFDSRVFDVGNVSKHPTTEFPKDMAYRETDINELNDILESGVIREMPEGKVVEGSSNIKRTKSGRSFQLGRPEGRSHGGKGFSKGLPWSQSEGKGTLATGKAPRILIGVDGSLTDWQEGFHGSYSDYKDFSEVEHGRPIFLPFNEDGEIDDIYAEDLKFWARGKDGKYYKLVPNEGVKESKRNGNKKTPFTGKPNRANEKSASGSVLQSIRGDSSSNPTTSKEADAKVINRTKSAKNKIQKFNNKDYAINGSTIPKAINELAKMFSMRDKGGSKYVKLLSDTGETIELRLSNHKANGNNFAQDNADLNVSIVIETRTYDPIKSDIDYNEFVYSSEDFNSHKDEIIKSIVNGVDGLIKTGEFSDESGLAAVDAHKTNANNSETAQTSAEENEERGTKFSLRTKPAPKKTQKVYKLMRLGEDGKLYPLFVDAAEPIDIGKWYDADSPGLDMLKKMPSGIHLVDVKNGTSVNLSEFAKEHPELFNGGKVGVRPSKDAVNYATANGLRWVKIDDTSRGQKRFGGESRKYWNIGINGSGSVSDFSMRPGWHAGSLPTMRQIGKGRGKNLRDDRFVWVEGEVPADIDYNAEAQQNPDKDIPDHIPEDGLYMKATNADKTKSQADLVGWYVAGSFKANRIISDAEARSIIDKFNEEHGLTEEHRVDYDYEREGGVPFSEEEAKRVNELNGVKEQKRSLVGVHNITEEKLAKALKLGGLANPSVAVIDSDRQSHKIYGDISLVMPSAKIDGQGTTLGDAETSMFPRRTKGMSLDEISERMKHNYAPLPISDYRRFVSEFMPRAKSLDEIRDRKGLLGKYDQKEDDRREISFEKIAKALAPEGAKNFDTTGYERLYEAARHDNPVKFVEQEYGIKLSDNDAEAFRDIVTAAKEGVMTDYFETKFERPVMLDEFASAVVPNDISEKVRKGLEEAGLKLHEYDRNKEGDRERAFNEAINERDDVKFSKRNSSSSNEYTPEERSKFKGVPISKQEYAKLFHAIHTHNQFKVGRINGEFTRDYYYLYTHHGDVISLYKHRYPRMAMKI